MARSFTGRRPRKLRLRGIEMKTPARIVVVLLGAMAALVALLAFRTAAYRPPAAVDVAGVELAEGVPVDQARAARHLSEAVRIRTVSHQDPAANDWSEWQRFRDWLRATYPETHRELTLELVAGHTLVYTWAGSDPARPPIVLMAHHDVVPVTPGTEDDWAQAPFDGVIADGAVWGRGSVDDKSSLVGMFEAVEALVTSGFRPLRTVIILSGHDEEAGGSGVRTVAGLWRERGVAPAFALDEGLAIVEDFSLLGRPVALIGVRRRATPRSVSRHRRRAVIRLRRHPRPASKCWPGRSWRSLRSRSSRSSRGRWRTCCARWLPMPDSQCGWQWRTHGCSSHCW